VAFSRAWRWLIFLPAPDRIPHNPRAMRLPISLIFFGLFLLLAGVPAARAGKEAPPTSGPTISGSRAGLKGRFASAPSSAPENVKRGIWATNFLTWRPYVWGGGHGTFYDRGYDCSGTISFFLHHAGLLDSPMPSKGFLTYGEPGRGKWITIYARPGHVFAVICGLRLDTTGYRQEEGPRWRLDARSPGGFVARHPPGF